MMKKIINRAEDVVKEMCAGIVLAHPELVLLKKYKVIKKRNLNKDKVTVISGGGSGHEPAHAGFIGKGMLDAAVCGDVFASPSQVQVYQAIRETAGNKGALLVIKNYSGDIMNFKNAAYLAEEDGILVDYVKVDDDIAVQDSLYTVGRRGVAGTIFVHKIAGAAAERGYALPEVKAAAEKTAAAVKSIGFAFTSCTVPAKGSPTFVLAEDEMEYGVGIHGEPGIRREKLCSADELANRMADALVKELHLEQGEQEIALLVNGFGATPTQELYLLNYAVNRALAKYNITIVQTLVGNYMTSIDMAGASISMLKLDEELKGLLFDACDTPGLKISGDALPVNQDVLTETIEAKRKGCYQVETDAIHASVDPNQVTLGNMMYMVDRMSACIIEHEVAFCALDSHAGDGDFGMSITKGFKELKDEWPEIIAEKSNTIGEFMGACSIVIMEHCGGASGPIWGSAFRAAAKSAGNKTVLTASEFAAMMQAVVEGIQSVGARSFGRGAVVGDKTLIDALVPCADSWVESAKAGTDVKTALDLGAKAAREGAKTTEKIVARMGRAGTVGERSLGYPDAGAHGIGVIFTAIAEAMKLK